MVESSSKCKLRYNIKEDLDGCLEVEFLSTSFIDFLGDGPNFIVRYESDVSSLGDVLPNELVGIFQSFLFATSSRSLQNRPVHPAFV